MSLNLCLQATQQNFYQISCSQAMFPMAPMAQVVKLSQSLPYSHFTVMFECEAGGELVMECKAVTGSEEKRSGPGDKGKSSRMG